MKGAEGLLVRLEKQGKQEDRMIAIEAFLPAPDQSS